MPRRLPVRMLREGLRIGRSLGGRAASRTTASTPSAFFFFRGGECNSDFGIVERTRAGCSFSDRLSTRHGSCPWSMDVRFYLFTEFSNHFVRNGRDHYVWEVRKGDFRLAAQLLATAFLAAADECRADSFHFFKTYGYPFFITNHITF